MKSLAPFLLVLCSCVHLGPPDEHSTRGALEIDGRTRTWLLHVPASLPPGRAALVLAFHGGGGNGRSMERLTQFSALSDREGFIVVYPDGYEKNWNDGRVVDASRAHREKIDDLAFVDALLDLLLKVHSVDPKRVFATGISNGAFFSHWLAAHRSERIAAIAPVAGGMAPLLAADFAPAQPVSVLILQGGDDEFVPIGGGEIKFHRGQTVSTASVVRKWTTHDGCGAPLSEELPDLDPKDECRVTRATCGGGRAGTEVVLYTIHGGGHTWPGGPQFLPEGFVGRVCRDVDATDQIWDFFRRHPKP